MNGQQPYGDDYNHQNPQIDQNFAPPEQFFVGNAQVPPQYVQQVQAVSFQPIVFDNCLLQHAFSDVLEPYLNDEFRVLTLENRVVGISTKCFYNQYCSYLNCAMPTWESLDMSVNAAFNMQLIGALTNYDESGVWYQSGTFEEKDVKIAPNWLIMRTARYLVGQEIQFYGDGNVTEDMENYLMDKENELGDLENVLDDKEKHLNEKERMLKEKEKRLNQKKKALNQKEKYLKGMQIGLPSKQNVLKSSGPTTSAEGSSSQKESSSVTQSSIGKSEEEWKELAKKMAGLGIEKEEAAKRGTTFAEVLMKGAEIKHVNKNVPPSTRPTPIQPTSEPEKMAPKRVPPNPPREKIVDAEGFQQVKSSPRRTPNAPAPTILQTIPTSSKPKETKEQSVTVDDVDSKVEDGTGPADVVDDPASKMKNTQKQEKEKRKAAKREDELSMQRIQEVILQNQRVDEALKPTLTPLIENFLKNQYEIIMSFFETAGSRRESIIGNYTSFTQRVLRFWQDKSTLDINYMLKTCQDFCKTRRDMYDSQNEEDSRKMKIMYDIFARLTDSSSTFVVTFVVELLKPTKEVQRLNYEKELLETIETSSDDVQVLPPYPSDLSPEALADYQKLDMYLEEQSKYRSGDKSKDVKMSTFSKNERSFMLESRTKTTIYQTPNETRLALEKKAGQYERMTHRSGAPRMSAFFNLLSRCPSNILDLDVWYIENCEVGEQGSENDKILMDMSYYNTVMNRKL